MNTKQIIEKALSNNGSTLDFYENPKRLVIGSPIRFERVCDIEHIQAGLSNALRFIGRSLQNQMQLTEFELGQSIESIAYIQLQIATNGMNEAIEMLLDEELK